MLDILGFSLYFLPLDYLGVPLHYKKIPMAIWHSLLEVIKAEIGLLSNKWLS